MSVQPKVGPMSDVAPEAAPDTEEAEHARRPGVLPSQRLRDAIADDWIRSDLYRIPSESIQPASLDLRLGDFAWALRCSFLPDAASKVEEKIADIAFQKIDLRDGATLERDRPYLVPLIEELALPGEIRGKANPKSSTGRLDVFTRVLTDGNPSFDEIPFGYRGKLYLEVVPRSYAIHVKTGLALNQLRLFTGDARLRDDEIRTLHEEFPLLYLDSHALRAWELTISDGLFLSVDLSGPADRIVGYRAKRNSLPIDLSRVHGYGWRDYWEPVYPEPGSRIVLEPEVFYLLLSAEGACIPPGVRGGDDRIRPDRRRVAYPLRRLLRSRVRLRPEGPPARLARGARGACPRRVVHGRAPPADLQARVRADARGARRALRPGARLELPGPGDDAEQALRRAVGGAPARSSLNARAIRPP